MITASLFSDDRLVTFLSGLGLLALFFWYFATDFERKKKNIGTIIVVLIAVFSLLSIFPKGQWGNVLTGKTSIGDAHALKGGIDLIGGSSFTLRVQPSKDADGTEIPVTPNAVQQAIQTVEKRLNNLGTADLLIVAQGSDRILVQMPGVETEESERIRETLEKSIAGLEAQGAELVEISLPHTTYAVATYYIIAPAEASSNLSRFDGVRYGNRIEKPEDVLDVYRGSREQGFGPEVKRRIILGTYVLSSGYYDAYYNRAQKVRTLIRKDFQDAYQNVDAILSPVTPTAAPLLGADKDDPLQQYLADIYTISANLAGICGVSVPCGKIASDSGTQLPVGLQILGPHMGEQNILKVARAAEQQQV